MLVAAPLTLSLFTPFITAQAETDAAMIVIDVDRILNGIEKSINNDIVIGVLNTSIVPSCIRLLSGRFANDCSVLFPRRCCADRF